MTKNNSNALGIAAMVVLILSLPLEWMTLHNARMQFNGGLQGLGNMMPSSMGTMTIKLTGINGHITFLAKLPIWLIVVVGLTGVLLAFLNSLRVISIPKLAALVPLSLSALYVIVALLITIGSSEATAGVGIFAALLGISLGYAFALTCQIGPEEDATSSII